MTVDKLLFVDKPYILEIFQHVLKAKIFFPKSFEVLFMNLNRCRLNNVCPIPQKSSPVLVIPKIFSVVSKCILLYVSNTKNMSYARQDKFDGAHKS